MGWSNTNTVIVMNIKMEEEIETFIECSQIYCCNFLSVQCELSVSFFLSFFGLVFVSFLVYSVTAFRADPILKSNVIAPSEVNKMISQNSLFEVENIHVSLFVLFFNLHHVESP